MENQPFIDALPVKEGAFPQLILNYQVATNEKPWKWRFPES